MASWVDACTETASYLMEHRSAPPTEISRGAEYLADLLTLSYEPMLTWSLEGPIEFWNAGAELLYEFSRAEAVGRTSHDLLQTKFPIDFAAIRSQLQDQRF